jgi:O-antigen chain-terminating methyltransferase
MRYHQFVPDTDVLASRIAGHEIPGQGSQNQATPEGNADEDSRPLPTTLEGLTALRDRAFVEAAYRVMLGREADAEGCEHVLAGLRGGTIDKVGVLGDLAGSPEGRQRSVHIAGLDRRYRLRRLGRLPVVGWFIRTLEAALRLPALVQAIRRQQAAIELASVEAEQHALAIQRIQRELRELRRLATRFTAVERSLRELRGESAALQDEMRTFLDRLGTAEHGLEARYQRLNAAVTDLKRQIAMSQPLSRKPADAATLPSPAPPVDLDRASDLRGLSQAEFDAFYLEFEDRFRGSREETKRLLEIYLEYAQKAGAGSTSAPVLDVGCGRGEWLELLGERGYVGRGVDTNRVMTAENRNRGLDVVEEDVLAYLARLPDESVGMVTGFHIIEHLPFDQVVRLFDECRRILRHGGCSIFETPNPENLVVGAYTFYFDPTHRHPLPPQVMEFLALQRGFSDVEILRLHPRGERGTDQDFLDRWFRGPADYAVIGWKGTTTPSAA